MTNSHLEQLQQQDMIYALAGSGDTCFAARASGLYRSEDAGQSWQAAYAALKLDEPLTTTAVAAAALNVFAGAKGGILRSSDGGEHWFTALLPPPAPLVSALAVSPDFDEDGVLVAGTAEDGVFVSTDRGQQWIPWNFGLLDLNVYAAMFSPAFAVDQAIYLGTETGVFRSRNGGRAWRPLSFPMDAAPVLSLGYSPGFHEDRRLFAGTETNGLYISNDGGDHWEPAGQPLNRGMVNAIFTAEAEIWILLDDGLMVSHDRGQSWAAHRAAFPEDGHAVAMWRRPQPASTMLVGFAEGNILRLT